MTTRLANRRHHVQVKVAPGEAERWHEAARQQDLRLSQFIRRLVRDHLAQGKRSPEGVRP